MKQIKFVSSLDIIRDPSFIGEVTIDYEGTKRLIESNEESIVTTQMSFLTTDLFERGYRVFVHDSTGLYELSLGRGNSRTTRELRLAHNLFKLWMCGEFDREVKQ